MPLPRFASKTSQNHIKIPLRRVIVASFVLQIAAAVGIVGYLSFRNGQIVVEEFAQKLSAETGKRVEEKLTAVLENAQSVNQLNAEAIDRAELNLQLERPQPRGEKFLWQQMRSFKSIQWISLGAEKSGEYLGIWRNPHDNSLQIVAASKSTNFQNIYYATDGRGTRTAKLKAQPATYDARRRPWYKEVVAANKPIWTSIYPGFTPGTVFIAASQPIRDRKGKLLGVCAVNFSLSEFQQYLHRIKLSKTGQIFAIERSGLLVASSSQESPFRKMSGKQELQRVNVLDSQTPVIRTAAKYLYEHFGGFGDIKQRQQLKFSRDGQEYFLEVLPFSDSYGLNWLIAIAVPKSDFLGEINRNTQSTILFCLVALLLSTIAGVHTARWVTLPLRRLNEAAKDIAAREFDRAVAVSRLEEVGELAQSFNEMAAQLKKSFQALAESEEKFAQLVENLPVGVSAIDPGGAVIFMNSAGEQILGRGEMPDATAQELAQAYQIYIAGTNQLYPAEQMPFVRALSGFEVIAEDMEIRRDGQNIRLDVRALPVFDGAGNILYVLTVFKDITARKQAEQILADYNRTLEIEVVDRTIELASINARLQVEIEERQQAEKIIRQERDFNLKIIENSPIFFVAIDSEGKILQVNDCMLQAVGYTAAEVTGKDYLATFVPPSDRAGLHSIFERVTASQQTVNEHPVLTKCDRTLLVEWHGIPVLDESGSLDFLFGFGIDIGERKQAQLVLQKSEALFHKLANTVPGELYILVQHPDGSVNMEYISPLCREIQELEPEEIQNNSALFYEQMHPDDRSSHFEAIVKSATDLELFSHEWRIVTASGKLKWLQGYSRPELRENGDIVWHGIIIDTSDRKQAEQELKQAKEAAEAANKTKSIFLANMSHELRTPLNAILGFAELMEPSANLSVPEKENIKIIRRSGEHLLQLINQVLDLSKIEAGRMTLNAKNFDLYRLLGDLQNMFQIRAQNKGLQLIIDCSSDVPQYVKSDEVKLRQVLINLLDNAVKFTEDGSVLVTVRHDREGITKPTGEIFNKIKNKNTLLIYFEIVDTGFGISPEELESIFELFVQSSSGKKVQKGTGLGLNISREFIKLMGGDITVESEVGRGTVFKFDIQVVTAAAPVEVINKYLEVNDLSESSSMVTEQISESAAIFTLDSMPKVSPEWTNNLKQAVRQADFNLIATIIEQIRSDNDVVAEVMMNHLYNFDYQKILDLIAEIEL
ncbi:PAS domain S-box protein [Microcoleus asticus]|uniref:histidine kinase n=1 Tax=Microcoleus asticus IPMA8 TaxID=2563858 RepID=A0ABX2D3Z1_9CYAN|nr:PAS domain S-box protein [Microcoleus asticus]NQE37357.1 Aerobic respiration control sensor protein ArcB [Microcoleus asticus IPMA8]